MNQEEEKKGIDDGEADDKPKLANLRCYDFPEISKIMFDGSIQFKKDTYEVQIELGDYTDIVHRLAFGYGSPTIFTVEGEWLNGKPHGICIVENRLVRGIMTFTHGKTDGPAWLDCIDCFKSF